MSPADAAGKYQDCSELLSQAIDDAELLAIYVSRNGMHVRRDGETVTPAKSEFGLKISQCVFCELALAGTGFVFPNRSSSNLKLSVHVGKDSLELGIVSEDIQYRIVEPKLDL